MNSRGRKRMSRRSNKTPRTEQRKSIRAAAGRFDTFESGNRRIPVVNHHCMSGADLAQIGAKVVFQL
jgi:hypothetical protein